MFKYAVVMILAVFLIAGASCDKIKIPGNIAGQILDENGAPRGMVSVQLVLVETGEVAEQQTADDMGNYFFSKVEPGTYQIKTLWGGREEMPNDSEEIKLMPGKTLTVDITVRKADKE